MPPRLLAASAHSNCIPLCLHRVGWSSVSTRRKSDGFRRLIVKGKSHGTLKLGRLEHGLLTLLISFEHPHPSMSPAKSLAAGGVETNDAPASSLAMPRLDVDVRRQRVREGEKSKGSITDLDVAQVVRQPEIVGGPFELAKKTLNDKLESFCTRLIAAPGADKLHCLVEGHSVAGMVKACTHWKLTVSHSGP